jgi:tripartite-type tricarboxylate transporter receptor subunit TctC
MSENLGQPIVIENKPGAGSMLGAQIVARAKPDGYTLLTATGANMITGPLLTTNQIFTPDKDIQPIAMLSVNPLVLVASNESGIKSLADLIAKAKAKPGQLAIGSYGIGTPPHLAIELLKMRVGIDVIHVPYNGSAPAMVDLRGGRIPVLMDFLPSQVKSISDREVVGLAIGQNKRSDLVPDVPTFDQAGLTGLEITTFFALAGPVGIPKEIVKRINEAARWALSDPALQKSMASRGLTLAHSTPEGFEEALKKETAQAKLIIQSAGIKNLD